jgi:azurin
MGPDHAEANFSVLASHLREGREMTTATHSVMQIPRESWNRDQAAPVAEAFLQWAKQVPAEQRTTEDYVETVQAGMEMAALLPPADATRIRKGLLDLGVRVFAIKSVREQMRFDTTRIVVEAGKPFEIIFENVDMMPHNLVVIRPGTREEIGLQADKMGPEPDRRGRAYVPRNRGILAATRMLEPGEKETIKLNAPDEPGDYEYVCTYPEHWKVMYGRLIVVRDLDAYLESAANAPVDAPRPASGDPAHEH